MASISRSTELPGPISAVEALWYDLRRRPSWVEGFGNLARVEGDWPAAGARLRWNATRSAGRGAVVELVDAHEDRTGQTVAYEDEQLRGTQVVAFAPAGDLVRVTVSLDWKLKEGNPFTDWLFVRTKVGESLRRTLERLRIERLADLDDERAAAGSAP